MTLFQGDCRAVLPTLAPESVQCCCTSPPYWGLRDYGTAQWEGGDPNCEHLQPFGRYGDASKLRNDGRAHKGPYDGEKSLETPFPYRGACGKCGARRIDSQLGLEATPEEYVANMVAVFREVWRVLRNDGTLWLNLGDSYASGNLGRNDADRNFTGGGGNKLGSGNPGRQGKHEKDTGLKPKDLVGIPWRVAFALQADGWYLRSDIIWSKCNPMPESVTDRPTKAHEYIFLLTKNERYFYDAKAIKEPLQLSSLERGYAYSDSEYVGPKMASLPSGEVRANSTWHGRRYVPEMRNKRTVWTIATQAYPEAHFATFPEEIPKLCILAGSKPGDTVLDPFAGSGTVGKVAVELGRQAILIELNSDYIQLARERTNVTPGFL